MAHESIKNLRLDRRLIQRRGWIDAAELETALANLEDASDKAELVGFDDDGAADEAAATQKD